MGDDAGEALTADGAGADVLVAVATGAELDLRVVGVDDDEVLDADLLLELGHRELEALGRRKVVAGGVGVLGVEADLHAVAPDFAHDPAEIGEGGADGAAGAGRVLEDELHVFRRGLDYLGAGDTDLLENGVE